MSSKYMFMIFIVTMHTWHDIIIRIFVPSMYIYLFCIFHLSISISIYLKRDDVMLANIFPWKQGHLLPPWIPSSLTTWTDQNKFAFPYQSRHQTYPKKLSNHLSKIHRVKLFGNMKPWNEPFRTILFSIKGNTILWKSISWFEGCGKNKGSLFWKQE